MAEDRYPEDTDRTEEDRSVDDTSAIPVAHTTAFPPYGPSTPTDSQGWGEPSPPETLGAGPGAAGQAGSSPAISGGSHPVYGPPAPDGGAPGYAAPGPSTSSYPSGAGALMPSEASIYAPPTPVPPRRRRGPGLGLLTGALVLGLLGGGAAGYLGGTLAEREAEPSPRVVEAAPVGTTPPNAITAIAQHALPSVVFISSGSGGVGSGFVVREDGYLVTNNHVIEGAGDDTVQVTFSDGRAMEAEIVGTAEEYDIAVLHVDASGLQALQFGDSEQLQVGASVVAVGAPLGLDNTVTSGIVSALNRPVMAGGEMGSPSYINAIQTDAAINPGNSGGPLLDLNGDVVGVNSAIAQIPGDLGGGKSGSIGLGFAIPSRQVERTATELIETGTSTHPIIGVMLDMSYTGPGAKVLEEGLAEGPSVVDGGPADEAGVQPGDLILEVDGETVEHGSHLIIMLRSHTVGDEVELLVRSPDGSERTVELTLQGSE